MPNTGANSAQLAADRVHAQLADLRVPSDNGPFGLQVSIGITSINSGNLTLEDLLKLGDRALYVAKANSRQAVSATTQLVC
jgi:diguanylate cyclase (GGDEF)-like protein